MAITKLVKRHGASSRAAILHKENLPRLRRDHGATTGLGAEAGVGNCSSQVKLPIAAFEQLGENSSLGYHPGAQKDIANQKQYI